MDGYFPVGRAMEQAKAAQGEVYIASKNGEIFGAFFKNFRTLDDKRVVMNIPLLGGAELWLWRNDLKEFLIQKANEIKANEFTILGRKGWSKLFPEFEEIGVVLRMKLPLRSAGNLTSVFKSVGFYA